MAESRYWPPLDGVRALAISAVIAYHLGYFAGGWIGVDIFFVLSGFLITSLLLEERRRSGTTRLRAFWARRAKRLLPAVLLMLLVVSVYSWIGGPGVDAAQLRAPALATLFYVANWQQIFNGHNYFTQFHSAGPLIHTWSLAIEEQYYLVWPILFVGLLWMTRPRTGRRLMVSTAMLGAASAAWMAVAYHTLGVNRAYLGTDTRAWELLLGGLAAMAFPSTAPRRRPRLWSMATLAALTAVGVGMTKVGGPWTWNGGLVAIAICVVVVIVGSVHHPQVPVARLLALRPLRWLGLVSYSLYLWHWPAIALMTVATTGLSGANLLMCRLAAMFTAACLSYYLVEQPLRHADWSLWWRRTLVPVGVISIGAIALAATTSPTTRPTSQHPPLTPPTASTQHP